MKTKVVKFTNGKAKIYTTIDVNELIKAIGKENTLINPNLNAVKGVPPELWQLVDNNIVPVTDITKHVQKIQEDLEVKTESVKIPNILERFVGIEGDIVSINKNIAAETIKIKANVIKENIEIFSQISKLDRVVSNILFTNEFIKTDISVLKNENQVATLNVDARILDIYYGTKALSDKINELEAKNVDISEDLNNIQDKQWDGHLEMCSYQEALAVHNNRIRDNDSELLDLNLRLIKHSDEIKKLNRKLLLITIGSTIITVLLMVLK